MRRILGLAGLLAGFWLALSGHYTGLLLSLGAASVTLSVWVVHRMGVVDRESLPVHLLPRLLRYLPWLTWEVLRSSVRVTRQVWSPRGRLAPAVGLTPTPELSELTQVIYANSITLTPGTLSLSVVDAGIEVHSLDQSGLAALPEGGMRARVRGLEPR